MVISLLIQGTKDGKDAWKKRKAALEEVRGACDDFQGLISTSPDCMSGLIELMRSLKDRLEDSQSNLKPIAAKIIGTILNSVDNNSQAKLGKIVYGQLIHAVLSDNKKVSRDAAIEALEQGTSQSTFSGGGVNPAAMEPLIVDFVTLVRDSDYKVSGVCCYSSLIPYTF